MIKDIKAIPEAYGHKQPADKGLDAEICSPSSGDHGQCEWEINAGTSERCSSNAYWKDRNGKRFCVEHGNHLLSKFQVPLEVL